MMNVIKKKILLAIDGSDQSLDAARYASKLLASQKTEFVLFHVLKKIDEAFWNMRTSHIFSRRISGIAAWEMEQEKKVQRFMNGARQILLDAGHSEEDVKLTIHECEAGIARDIIRESQQRYDAVVLGRRGLSKLKDLVLGSIADKLIEKLSHVAVWMVGGSPESKKILLALDASEGAMKAVDYVGAMLGGSNIGVTLLHVARSINVFQMKDEESFPSEEEERLEREWVKAAKVEIGHVFDEARTRLVNAGLEPSRITTKFIPDATSRAGAIVEEANLGGYGTIAVGRRGMSKIEEFFMGRVSNKVIHLAKGMAVWAIS